MKLCALMSFLSLAAHASDDFKVASAYTIVGQTSDNNLLSENTTGSVDLFLNWGLGGGRLEVYAEGNNSLKANGVATRLPRSNADAGSALDPDSSGRFQLSELKYSYAWPNERSVAAGLIDPTVYLDATRINNDENLQFLGASFVNNPTIEFPDYTLGFATQLPGANDRQQWTLVLAGSNGIADNPNRSYSQLFEISDHRKGFFAGVETAWESRGRRILAGAWLNTADHTTLDGKQNNEPNHGFYAAAKKSLGSWAANVRVGVSDPDVSIADRFAAISLQRAWQKYVFGVAAARLRISTTTTAPSSESSSHAEAYLRFELGRDLFLTPSIQYLTNAGYDSSTNALADDTMVFSLRLHHVIFNHPGD